jgi:ankyrin repeat protein
MDATAQLHGAAASGDEAAVRLALQSAAAHVQEEEHGRSALMLAAAGGHEAVVSLLLSSGAHLCPTHARCGRPARPKRLMG